MKKFLFKKIILKLLYFCIILLITYLFLLNKSSYVDNKEAIILDNQNYILFKNIGEYFLTNSNLKFYTLYPDNNTKNRAQITDKKVLFEMQKINAELILKYDSDLVEFFFKKSFDKSKKQCVYLYQKNNAFKKLNYTNNVKKRLSIEYWSKFWKYEIIIINDNFAKWCLIWY